MDRLPPTTSNTFDIIHDTEKFCVTKHAGERKNTHYPLTHPPPHLDFLLKALQSNSITNYHCKPLLLHFLLLRPNTAIITIVSCLQLLPFSIATFVECKGKYSILQAPPTTNYQMYYSLPKVQTFHGVLMVTLQ